MEIFEVGQKEYTDIIRNSYHIFSSASFNDLNRNKCDEVNYLLFKQGKFRLGIIGGTVGSVFYSPFSAPFGGFSFVSPDVKLQYIEEALKLLKIWSKGKGILSLNITIPPAIYEPSFISKQLNCLWRAEYNISKVELNYSFDLQLFDSGYLENVWYNARKNIRISMKAGLEFLHCSNLKEKEQAYKIIAKNREQRGYPLRMSWQQVLDTSQIVQADFFLVKESLANSIASAIVFHVSTNIVQVIYWGDLIEYSNLRTMNFIAYKLFEYYKSKGTKLVDIGPSTEDSIPNYGLAEFKESIGCRIDPKYSFTRSC